MRFLLIGLVLCGLGLGVQAQPETQARQTDARVVIVSSDGATAYADAAKALIDTLVREGVSRYEVWQITALEMAALQNSGQVPQARVFVALGADATAVLARSTVQKPVLSALIPRSSFERVLRDSGRKASSQFSALYLDQPVNRQLALVRLAIPKVERVGVLWGAESGVQAHLYRQAATANGLTLVEARVAETNGIFPALKQVLDGSDVLLAVADPQVYNSNSLQNILLSAFRAHVPMIGFSPAYARAGALLALDVTPAQAGRQAAALVQGVLRDKPLPAAPVESDDFEVVVNEHVARAMNVVLDGAALRLALRRMERLP